MAVLQLIGQGGLVPAPDANAQFLVTALPFAPTTGFDDESHVIRGSGSPASVIYNSIGYQPAATISTDNFKFPNYGASFKKPVEIPADIAFHSSELGVDTGSANTIGTKNYCYEAWFYTDNFTWNGGTQLTLLYSANAAESLGSTATDRDCPSILIGSDTFVVTGVRRGIRLYQQPNNTGILDTTPCLSPQTWHHIAVTRSGTTARIFVDGVLRATGTDSKNYTGWKQAHLASLNRTLTAGMYFQDVRFYVGAAKYTAAFTPPGPMFI